MGRDVEFRRALAALNNGEFQGVALVGDSGVGKSTLARMLAKATASAGRTVRFALGTQTGRAVPLGAFSRAVTLGVAYEPAIMLAAAHKTLGQDNNLVVVVDDAQLLDPLSATLVNQLATSRAARLIVTIGLGESVLDAVSALIKERLLLSIHIDPFTREQTGVLASAVLGGPVEARLTDELYERSSGNLLVLRGLLSASRDNGAFARTDAGWQLRGPLLADRELHDLIEFRLRTLAPEELEVVEFLATAELLEWEVLREICDADAAARLERRGMIQLFADRSQTMAQLNDPVVGEVALEQAGVVRSRQLNGTLAQAVRRYLQAEGKRVRSPDLRGRIRLAQFIMRSDLEPDLDLVIKAAADAIALSNSALGEELARFAFERGGGLRAALLLAEALSWQGRGEEAEAICLDVDLDDADRWLVARWGCARAANLFWLCRSVEAAKRVLAEVRDRVASEPSIGLIFDALELSFAYFGGDVARTVAKGPDLCGPDAPPAATIWAAAPTASALALTGRLRSVQPIVNAGLRAAKLCKAGPQIFGIGMAELAVPTAAGDYAEAERVCNRYASMAAGLPTAEAMVQAMFGFTQLARGELRSACSSFTQSISELSFFPSPWLMLVAARHAQAEGARGESEAAAAALRIAEDAYGPHMAVFLPELQLARAWHRASVADTATAQAHATQAAQTARAAGLHAFEMKALHTAVRFGDRAHAARLEELAGALKTSIAEAVAMHARGLARHDGDLIDAAAHRFDDLGACAFAADASAQAASEHARRGDRSKEVESSNWAYRLAGQCELRTPALEAAARPLPFSGRERQIVMLVVAGLSNRQIADRLVISVRTVEGHLYRIFTKLGINTRDQLVHLIGRDPSGRNGLPGDDDGPLNNGPHDRPAAG
ncbi:LuxR C-terminal-related transcriptional regulator [Mycobacterium sp. 852002-51057_SCH5723018]|uniref:LuxR C-terminal-related transcriptional regulator n=1 Tax=Mycobacterium sp. 852002-51057_SCH5723018 TaxID=1834094 RepID=UPI0007FC80F9|nr:LuxR C-terminal-related transcriptional regulator [Mycobacterium sp. 852002-51057_SCH5723018]OBG29368.1 LuxR family transcriptional regulator [Mycobacterium sp. 852002-51057_SCH5723018]